MSDEGCDTRSSDGSEGSPMARLVQGCDVCLDGVRWDGDDAPAFCACPMGVALRARAA